MRDRERKAERQERKAIVLLSPHLDDAVFSVGGLMAALAEEGHALHVITCFTRSVPNPTGFALNCQLDKGLGPEVDYMQLRRREDEEACCLLSAQPHWLDLPEAPHRGYSSASALFGNIAEEDNVQAELLTRLQTAVEKIAPDLILSPIGIGNHVDHQQVKQSVAQLKERFSQTPFLYWYDEPYLSRHPDKYPEGELMDLPPGWASLEQVISTTAAKVNVASCWDKKMAACGAYATQIGFQFGGKENISAVLSASEKENEQLTELVVR